MPNDFVKAGYNQAATSYTSDRDLFKNQKYLEMLAKKLTDSSTILDIGCGAGIPIDQYFVKKGHKIIGLDISEKQIELAQKNLPDQQFEVKDMSELKSNDYHVQAVVSFYAIFHTSRDQHLELLKTINSFLLDQGWLLITMGASEWEGTEEFHGVSMFWSHFGSEKNKQLVEQAGFKIDFAEVDDSGGEKHLVVLAQKG